MIAKLCRAGTLLSLLVLSACGLGRCDDRLSPEALSALYTTPLSPPEGPQSVFHLGHSLVGRDMPAMLAQLAGHDHASQLGWGTPLKAHWEPGSEIAGFDAENDHSAFRPAKEALRSGDYDVLVLTEMVEIEAAIDHFSSSDYLARWARLAFEGNPDIRVYLYETWHALDDPKGWMARLDTDPAKYWEGRLLAEAQAGDGLPAPIHVIPAGRVFAEVVRRLESGDGAEGVTSREDFFARLPDGSVDPIHLNDLGAYLVALVHYAVIYHQSPQGLPRQLTRADGTPADAPGPHLADLLQQTVWQVVTELPITGVATR